MAAIVVALVAVATGAGLLLGLSRGLTVGPSNPPPTGPAPSTLVVALPASIAPDTPPPRAAVRAGALIAYTRTVDRPVWSLDNPNGARCYGGPTCPASRLWIVGSDGNGAHELFPDGGSSQRLFAWSPDGSRLLYADGAALYLTDLAGSSPELLDTGCVAPCVFEGDAAFSTDGTRLVVVRTSTGASGYDDHNAITTMDLATGRVVELRSTAPAGGNLPEWSPDGTQIAFFRYGDKDWGIAGPIPPKNTAIFIVDADGQNLRQVSPATLPAQFPRWSPDGSSIVFTSVDGKTRDIYAIRPDGTDLHQLTSTGRSYGATWTPDGRILFVRGTGPAGSDGGPSFWTMDADGSNATQVVPGKVTGAAPEDFDWSRGPIWQPIGGPSIVPPPWNPSTSTPAGPPPPTPPATPMPDLAAGFSWTGSTSFSVDTATVLGDGRVLVTSSCGAALELYDPTSETFSPTGSLTVPRGGGKTATLLRNGQVLIAGGGACGGAQTDGMIWASAEVYDPATGTSRATGSMGTPRVRHTATLLADGRVLIAGGYTGQSPVASATVVFASYEYPTTAETAGSNTLSSAELYDPVAGTFSPTGSMTVFRDNHTATLLENGRVLVAGGGGEGYARNSAEVYNPASGTFSSTGSMWSERWLHTATLLRDGRVLITGGRSPNDTDYASAELYDPATGKFTLTGSMHAARQQHTATLLADGRVFIAGGYLQDAAHWDVLAATELYDPATRKFTTAGSMGEQRSGQAATLIRGGRVLIVGGNGVGYPFGEGPTSAVLYQP